MKEECSVLSPKLSGGPKGLGDPDDRSLRRVEKDVMVPKLMRDRVKAEKCVDEVKEFHDCCLNTGILHVVKCRRENDKMQDCMKKWYYNDDFIKECTEQYLDERSEFRKTGVPKKQRNVRLQGGSM
ncbi:PREDICTED: COX assembly mitochondrial protein homolog [Wasmannia auropunctata]|uniref:COX assembly mitochondrial protein homolog n=1 Tax=Wasmannia auropunctata TaxID=64793 RepID=UPI0005EE7B04|nr:PREDICTED: COX assembly mitochondrial protein homolog [Wasmannia auropunctata]